MLVCRPIDNGSEAMSARRHESGSTICSAPAAPRWRVARSVRGRHRMRRNHLGLRQKRQAWLKRDKVIVFGLIKRNDRGRSRRTTGFRWRDSSMRTPAKEWQALCHVEATWWARRRVGPSGATTSTASKASGAMPRIGYIPTIACPAITSTCPDRGQLPVQLSGRRDRTPAFQAYEAHFEPELRSTLVRKG